MEKELMDALDEELDGCIKKFRNAVYGDEVRTFITEYEELMLKKSDVVVEDFLKEGRRGTLVRGAALWKASRQPKYLSTAALTISIIALLISLATAL